MSIGRPALLAGLALAACAGPAAPTYVPFEPYVPEPGTPESIAYEAGITRFLGETEVVSETPVRGATSFELDPASGPMCMRGAPFRTSTREGSDDRLLIFLQGGGACWTGQCFGITEAPAGVAGTDLLATEPANPLRDFDVLYLPYCDGSLFTGDADVDEDGDGTPERFHRGLANLSAALAIGFERFPHPTEIVLAGSSAGGFGTILAVFLVRYVYPDVPIVVLNDAGIGIVRPGDPAFISGILEEWGSLVSVPADCPECISDGNVTGVVDYALRRDPNLRVAQISSHYDFVISDFYLHLGAEPFQAALMEETDALAATHPETYRRFLYTGDAHTALLGGADGLIGSGSSVELPPDATRLLSNLTLESLRTTEANGVMLSAWLPAFVDGELETATSVVDEPGPLPDWATMP